MARGVRLESLQRGYDDTAPRYRGDHECFVGSTQEVVCLDSSTKKEAIEEVGAWHAYADLQRGKWRYYPWQGIDRVKCGQIGSA